MKGLNAFDERFRKVEPTASRESTCPLCGQPITFKVFRAHMQSVHPEYVAAQQKWDRDFCRGFGKVALPGLAAWVAAIALILFLPLSVNYLVAMGITVAALMVAAGVYAYRATSADESTLHAFRRRCRICDAEMAGTELEEHLRRVHPEETRYLAEARAYALGSLAAIAALMLYLAVLLSPYVTAASTRNFGIVLTKGGFFLWLGVLFAWRRFVDSRHVARVRRIWQHSHGNYSAG